MSEVTRILSQINAGDPSAASKLLPLVYEELRRLSARKMAAERPDQTMQATALVHEAYLRLVGGSAAQQWDNRGHFFAAAAEAMRRILIERARKKASLRRGGKLARQPQERLDEVAASLSQDQDDLLELDAALTKLAQTDATAANLVKLRYFAGLTMDQIAEMTGVSQRTAYYTWTYARSWLRCEMRGE